MARARFFVTHRITSRDPNAWLCSSLPLVLVSLVVLFETVRLWSENTRVVGGLLSPYDLSGDKVDIAYRLLPAWDTPSGIPHNIFHLAHRRPHLSISGA